MDKNLNIFQNSEVDLNINGGPTNINAMLGSYDCVILKPNKKGSYNVLEQWMVSTPHTKYVVKYDFNLEDKIIEVSEDCIIDIDCGSLQHGTLVGDNTVLINANNAANALVDVHLDGTWKKTDLEEAVEQHSETLGNLKDVAFSGSYNDLSDKPSIPVIPENIQYVSSGDTRPTDAAVGQMFFDTSLGDIGKPIWYAGDNTWVYADGTTVE